MNEPTEEEVVPSEQSIYQPLRKFTVTMTFHLEKTPMNSPSLMQPFCKAVPEHNEQEPAAAV